MAELSERPPTRSAGSGTAQRGEESGPLPSQSRRRGAFHSLTVSAVRQLTPDAIEVAFAVPDELANAYDYEPGQYIAIRTTLGDDVLRRSYSICQAPEPGELKVAIKRDLGGVFSGWRCRASLPA